jgi:DNA-directed RNA polymerase specialized sigma subunit
MLMTIKDRLKEYRDLCPEIDSLDAELDLWTEQLNNCMPSAMRSKEIDYKDNTGDIAAMIESRQLEIDAKRRKLYQENRILSGLIDDLPRTQRTIMRNRYLVGRPWKMIAAKIGYSLSRTYSLHDKAIELLENKVRSSQ